MSDLSVKNSPCLQTSMRDYAKSTTVCAAEFERMRLLMMAQLHASIEPKGWLNKLFHRMFRVAAYY